MLTIFNTLLFRMYTKEKLQTKFGKQRRCVAELPQYSKSVTGDRATPQASRPSLRMSPTECDTTKPP